MNSQKTIWNKKRSAKRTANHANRAYVINKIIKALNSKEQYWKKKGSEAEVEVPLVLFPHSRSSS